MARSMVVLFALGVAGCGRTYSACSGNNELVEAVVDTSGDVPVFDWDLGTAYALTVYALDDDGEFGEEMWHVQCGGDNLEDDERLEEQVCITTPIAYGEEVDSEFFDTVNTVGPRPLTPGADYQLRVSTMIEEDGEEPESEHPEWMDFLYGDAEAHDDPHCGSGFSAEVDFVATGTGIPEGD